MAFGRYFIRLILPMTVTNKKNSKSHIHRLFIYSISSYPTVRFSSPLPTYISPEFAFINHLTKQVAES